MSFHTYVKYRYAKEGPEFELNLGANEESSHILDGFLCSRMVLCIEWMIMKGLVAHKVLEIRDNKDLDSGGQQWPYLGNMENKCVAYGNTSTRLGNPYEGYQG